MKEIQDLSVNDLMTKQFEYVGPNSIMTEVAEIFDSFNFHHLPVLDREHRPLGVISRHDYYQLQHHFTHFGWKNPESNNRSFFKTLLAQEVMSEVPISLPTGEGVEKALDIFLENKVHSILIISEEKCVGVLTPFDILKALRLTSFSRSE